MRSDERTYVSARWLCRRFEISHHTLNAIVAEVGDERMGRHQLPTMKWPRFERLKAEEVLGGVKQKD